MNKFNLTAFYTILISVLLIIVLLTSCNGEAKESTQDGDFKIELLFEKDGCKVYRFMDGGRYIYWSNCSGNIQSNYYKSYGKTGSSVRMESFINSN